VVENLARELDKSRDKLDLAYRHLLDYFKAFLRGDNEEKYYNICQFHIANLEKKSYLAASAANSINRPKEAIEVCKNLDLESERVRRWVHVWGYWTTALHMLGNYKQELKVARRGRKYHPERFEPLGYEMRALVALGRIKEVNKLAEEILTFPSQKGSPYQHMVDAALELRAHGYLQQSRQVLERAFEWLESRNQGPGAGGFYMAERWEEAQDRVETAYKKFPDSEVILGLLGALAARRGDKEEAKRFSSLLENMDRPYLFGRHTLWRARIASLLGEKENAIRLLREALAQGVSYTALHPVMDFEPLQDYPPFQELIKPKG
jgi:tetratricopeptide (TPR) repeat protein